MVFNEFKIFYFLDKILKAYLDSRHYNILFHIYDKMLGLNCLDKRQKDFIIEYLF